MDSILASHPVALGLILGIPEDLFLMEIYSLNIAEIYRQLNGLFSSKPRTYFYIFLVDGVARIFPTSCATTGNQTQVSSVAPLVRDPHPGRFTD